MRLKRFLKKGLQISGGRNIRYSVIGDSNLDRYPLEEKELENRPKIHFYTLSISPPPHLVHLLTKRRQKRWRIRHCVCCERSFRGDLWVWIVWNVCTPIWPGSPRHSSSRHPSCHSLNFNQALGPRSRESFKVLVAFADLFGHYLRCIIGPLKDMRMVHGKWKLLEDM